ncbi:geranylgeranyl reductase family protein [Actinocorallia sp. A-T 12471]|uniref:geranylgeranyl reductase family protein n=1 Tax=Actinocorallia sp. A-T 12471 TaxID=3089813 RepID=UPI0029D0C2EA|nr:geranylgeranyl reductase family protein [Actinocorallia sp. A-T 12471]MDX6741745.1 geranylgeranyl reductase family protein [Actinocorallia sp. A-T 12471]
MSEHSPEAADVIVVGAGPAGSTTAYYLAQTGLKVLLLEKATFPRDKICGDGLTPRAVRQLIAMGVDINAPGWIRNKGLRIYGGGVKIELPWPELATFPDFGLVRPRMDLDALLAEHAVKAGATLMQGTTVTEPVIDERSDRVIGVRTKDGREYRAPLVVAADGNSARLALALGIRKREDRPMGVAVRRYFETPRHDDDYLESWLELWDGEKLLPGYGWVFGCGNGTSNVGLGLLNTSKSFQNTDYREMLRRWTAGMPKEWQFDEAHATGPVRGAALPMGFNRQPHYSRGLLLVGDAGGMINPFNGEGIDYAMESGHLAADIIVQALARPTAAQRERALYEYPRVLKEEHGGYFTIGRVFVNAIGDPRVMKFATRHGLPHPTLMRFTLKLLANLTDPRGGDAMDRIINAMTRIAPSA